MGKELAKREAKALASRDAATKALQQARQSEDPDVWGNLTLATDATLLVIAKRYGPQSEEYLWWEHFKHVELDIEFAKFLSRIAPRMAKRGNPDLQKSDDRTIAWRDLGLDKRRVSEAKARAILTKKEREEAIEQARAKNRIPTSNTLLKAARDKIAKEDEAKPKPPPPKGTYCAIVIDPPWKMDKIDGDSPKINQGKQLGYRQMSVEEIKELPVPKIMAKDGCRVYLWTTQKYLCSGEAFDIIRAWGLKPMCVMVWHKPGGMMPFGVNEWTYNAEFVIFSRKGKPPISRKGQKLCFDAKRRQHSRKPDEFYEIVKAVGPGPRLDMFSREKRDGFEQWGDQPEAFSK